MAQRTEPPMPREEASPREDGTTDRRSDAANARRGGKRTCWNIKAIQVMRSLMMRLVSSMARSRTLAMSSLFRDVRWMNWRQLSANRLMIISNGVLNEESHRINPFLADWSYECRHHCIDA